MLVRAVGRQQRRHVDIQRQQVANRVPVLRAIEPVDAVRPARVGIERGAAVQLRFQPREHVLDDRRVGPRPARRRHRAAPQLADDLLPHLRAPGDVDGIHRLQGKIRRQEPVIVATDAVAVQYGTQR